jgi:uncharacterized protein (DUF362 family)/Pyruvate/2-oxoacid:ferredoxin oxidoreductase delta subunit
MPQTADVQTGKPSSSPVSIARCDGYDFETVRTALKEALAPLGGMQAFVKPGERIGLKPNLLLSSDPGQAIITHPAVLAAVAVEVKEAGAVPVVLESPGTGIIPSPKVLARLFAKAGYQEVADRHDFDLSLETGWEWLALPDGRISKKVEIIKSALEVDGLINLPKFKTHAWMILSGAVKNLFGLIPGLTKVGYHGKFAQKEQFAGMLVDIAERIQPRLNIMDAVLAMEGHGPGTGGKPRRLDLLLASADGVALDAVCCGVAGFDPQAIPVLVEARQRGLWSGRVADVPVHGPSVADLALRDFLPPSKGVASTGLEIPIIGEVGRRFLTHGFSPRPRPQAGPCTICGSCAQACPVEAIVMDKKSRVARVDDDKCIRCYCCHEMCPHAAIELRFTGLGRVMHRLGLV